MNTAARALFLSILPSILVSGCVRRIDFGDRGRLHEPEQVLTLMRQAAQRVSRLESHATLTAHGPSAHGTVAIYVAVERPASLHLETLGFFGKPMTVLVSDGTHFGFYDAHRDTFTTGPSSTANLARFFPVGVSGEALVTLLLGGVPILSAPHPTLRVDEKARAYRVALSRPPDAQTLWVDPESFRLLRARVRGPMSYEVELSDFTGEAGTDFPQRLHLKVPDAKEELELRYTRLTANGDLDPELFSTAPPEGVRVIRVDAEGRPVGEGPTGDSGSAPPISGPTGSTG